MEGQNSDELSNYQYWQQMRFGDVLPEPPPMFDILIEHEEKTGKLLTSEESYVHSLLQPPF